MAKSKNLEEAVNLKVVVEASLDTPTYYVNHAEIAVSQHEFAILFARLPTKPSRAEIVEATSSGELVVDPEFQILIPPTLLQGLIDALEKSRDQYDTLFGAGAKKEDKE
jgi:hypothetical protein